MLYLLVILLAIILGVLFGTFKRKKLDISYIRLEKVWLAFLAFGIQTITRIFSMKGVSFLVKYSWLTQGVVFVLLFVALWYNRKHLGLWIIALGASLNALVMMVNGGRMPVSLEKLVKVDMPEFIELIKSGADNKHVVMSEATKLNFLADIFYLPGFLGKGAYVLSIGDYIVAAGLFIFVFGMVSGSYKKHEEVKI
ncbi:DUF5317 domain-containing protein [Acetivibrio saccincola]|jgi:hypothetical protein|uniref:DUF5317 domain-containing protein n=1 Tax=Acetivibrio saccincola TaxID=1677857 RepID=A0A2K9E994_9FIRM|nr:DUF5317 domain-containing protein [Acetivibrio saccincola]AUG58186.1 hypothetical protein HVS_11470 [Acetivibrio saccincola]NLW26690.1 DUF5317 domain-containing protein [Acetivibrio saccincola]PQQ68068.1 hypothetical protein B9R14_15680 [Acetivibrio saccincola]HOA96444.1 DUF5317 domain-containing protein [Acetivibrio saccincola]HQD27678.1 DUF5317 domain-containing protein [Acetivibrio saccincola]